MVCGKASSGTCNPSHVQIQFHRWLDRHLVPYKETWSYEPLLYVFLNRFTISILKSSDFSWYYENCKRYLRSSISSSLGPSIAIHVQPFCGHGIASGKSSLKCFMICFLSLALESKVWISGSFRHHSAHRPAQLWHVKLFGWVDFGFIIDWSLIFGFCSFWGWKYCN